MDASSWTSIGTAASFARMTQNESIKISLEDVGYKWRQKTDAYRSFLE